MIRSVKQQKKSNGLVFSHLHYMGCVIMYGLYFSFQLFIIMILVPRPVTLALAFLATLKSGLQRWPQAS